MITREDYDAAFEKAWRERGGTWIVAWADGSTVSGSRPPDKPKLRIIQGGKP